MSNLPDRSECGHHPADFTQTRWTLVYSAAGAASPEQALALEELCRRYWYPIYAFVRRKGHTPEDSQDFTQEFFGRLIKRQIIAAADPDRGRFRSFLLGTLKHFLSDEWDKARAEKRGGNCAILSLDQLDPEERYRLEPSTDVTPETLFHRKWAMTVLDCALTRLQKECIAADKEQNFELLKPFLTSEPEKADYERLSPELQMKPNAIAVTVHRMRQRFGELVRAEIADTVADRAEVELELKNLFS